MMRDGLWDRGVATAIIAALLVIAAGPVLAASGSPFGVGRPEAAIPAATGFGGWVIAQQSAFYHQLSAAVRASATSSHALLGLMGIGLAYGAFHAAGPGHGKALISAYLFASGDGIRRGLVLSAASALLQALAAIALVAVLGLALRTTAQAMDGVALTLERISYALIAAVGAAIAWRKGRELLAMRRGATAHVHSAGCNHAIAPGRGTNRSALGTVLAVGIRPCTGAIIVLVFALAQGVFLAGVAATFAMAVGTAATVAAIAAIAVLAKGVAVRLAAPESVRALAVLKAIEAAAGAAIVFFGASLLVGALSVSQL
jgi:nickel/cobalt exporter